MTIYGYARLSIDKADSLSIETQRQTIEAYWKMRFPLIPYEPLNVYADPGVSGSVPIATRPQGKLLFALLQRGDQVIFAKLDRAFRSMSDGAQTLALLERMGVAAHFLDLGVDTAQITGKLVCHVLTAVAEMERSRIGERIRESKAIRRKQGRPWMGPRSAPIGWQIVAKAFVRWPEEQTQCRRLWAWRAKGRTVREIMKRAYDAGMRSLRSSKPLSWHRVRMMLHAAEDGFPLLSQSAPRGAIRSHRFGTHDWNKPTRPKAKAAKLARRSYRVADLDSPTFGLVDATRPECHKPRRSLDTSSEG